MSLKKLIRIISKKLGRNVTSTIYATIEVDLFSKYN